MRINIIKNNLKRPDIIDEASKLYKEILESIKYRVDLSLNSSTKNYTIKYFDNTFVGRAFAPAPEEILQDYADTGKLAILIYSSNILCNPIQYPYYLKETTPISIPEEFYINATNPTQTLLLYLLHEHSHAGAMLFDNYKTDLTHLPNNRNMNPAEYDKWNLGASTENQIKFYIHLVEKYKDNLDPEVPNTPPTRTLKKGMIGIDVMNLQKDLRTLGYFTYPINTLYFGSVTDKAVKAFQKANGLVVDRIVGKNTFAKIEEKKTLKSKTAFLDLSKWKLTYDCENKARQFLTICRADGYDIKITSGYRSQKEQDKLYAQGRTDKSKPIVTYAKVSEHTSAKAFDIAFEGKDPYPENFDWSILGKIGKSVGLKWGGDFKSFKDNLHFEI